MNILGIDPGLRKTGWGIIHRNGSALKFIASGLIKPDPAAPLPYRLAELHEGIADIIKQYAPDEAAIEETFVNKSPADALKLGQARGVLLAVPALYGLPTAEYSANKVKKSVVGSGHAAKQQIGMMVKTLLPACGTITEDEADALAVAITHAHYRKVTSCIIPCNRQLATGNEP
ncbi:MAG: crossover junction endodeoxyribonuclease RuvC [Bdellovibrionales bacterium]